MVELEKGRRFTAPAGLSDERATPFVPQPHIALDIGRYVLGTRRRSPASPRLVRGGELGPREVREKGCQRAINDRRHISTGDRMPKEILRCLELVPEHFRSREPKLVPVLGARGHRWRPGQGRRGNRAINWLRV